MFKFHPYSIMTFGAVVVLFMSLLGFQFAGPAGFLLSACILMIPVSMAIGYAWIVYPWQMAIIGCIPSCLFLVWRFITASTPLEESLNQTLFIFLPIISLASSYFGSYIGRWLSIKRKRKSKRSK